MSFTAKIDTCIQKILPELVDIRHDLHAHPELGYQETRTSDVIKRELRNSDVSFIDNLAGGTGVLGHIKGKGSETVGLRADIDALPIMEVNTFDYKSVHEGCMHACGVMCDGWGLGSQCEMFSRNFRLPQTPTTTKLGGLAS